MSYTLRFVDSISATPTVRLDLMAAWIVRTGTEIAAPPLSRVTVSTPLGDGDRYPAAAYGNRTIRLVLQAATSATDDDVAAAMQTFLRELDRASNILEYRPGTSAPLFYLTYRAGPENVIFDPTLRQITALIPAQPFGLGLEETLVTSPINPNTDFESGTTGWSTDNSVIAQSSTYAHGGTYSLQITPTGGVSPVSALTDFIDVTEGTAYLGRFYAYSPTGYATGMQVSFFWYTSAGVFISTALATVVPIPAGSWTLVEGALVAPAGAGRVKMRCRYMGTPAAADVVYVDDAGLYGPVIMHDPAVGSGCYLDLGGIKGDVETPLVLQFDQLGPALWSIRRRGTVSEVPLLLQAESMTPLGTDTTVVADATCSGGSKIRCTFATAPGLAVRTASVKHPSSPTLGARGRYRVLMRCAKTVAADVITASLRWSRVTNDTVTLSDVTTEWRMIDLGDVQIPMGNDPVSIGYGPEAAAVGINVSLNLGRTSGSGSLDVDYLLFVPADDRLSIVDTAGVVGSVWDGVREMAYTVSGGAVDGSNPDVSLPIVSSIPSGSGAMYVSPGVTNRIFMVARMWSGTVVAGHTVSGSVQVAVSYWPRYTGVVRPVES